MRKYWVSFFLCFLFFQLSSQTDFKFNHFSSSEGLSSSYQNCIIEDSKGFLWVGTPDGLNKFDGYSFKVFKHDPSNPKSLAENNIKKLFIDSKNRLWIGTENSISMYDTVFECFKSDFSYDSTPVNYPKKVISSIVSSKKSGMYLITYNGYLFRFDEPKNQFRFINIHPEPIKQTLAACMDEKENIWIGAYEGLFRYSIPSGKLEKIASGKLSYVSAILPDNDVLWIGTFGSGLYSYNTITQKLERKDDNSEPSEMQINAILKDSKGAIWVTTNRCLKMLDKKAGHFRIFMNEKTDPSSISTSGVLGIFEDKNHYLWVGGNGGALNVCYNIENFKHYRQNDFSGIPLTRKSVQCIFQDHEDNIWVGSFNGGIDVIDVHKNTLKHLEAKSGGIGDGTIFKILEDKSQNIWICSYRDGIQKYNPQNNSFTRYSNRPADEKSIASNDIRDMVEDSLGNFWIIAHGKGLDYFDRKSNVFKHFTQDANDYEHSLTGNWGYRLLIDKKGRLWIGTSDGFGKMNKNGTFTNYRNIANANSLSNNFVTSMLEDKSGNLWIGTGWGLNKFNPITETFSLYTQKDGLSNDIIKGILEDNKGNIWVSTNHGLSMLDIKTDSFKNYFQDDGLQDNEFIQGAYFKNNKGELFFGGINGFNSFHPEKLKINQNVPPVYLTGFKLFYQTVLPGEKNSPLEQSIGFSKELTLKYGMSVFSFEFAALNFMHSERNRYACKMEGFDNDWIQLDNRREVTYTNLNPGYYTFNVIASNDDNVWNTKGASIRLIIKPPFWRSVWAYIIYFMLLGLILFAYRRYILQRSQMEMEKLEWRNKMNLERIEAEKRHELDDLKLKFFTNISHEFRTPLTLIISPLESFIKNGVDSSKETTHVQLKLMYKNALRLLHLINQILSIRKLESGSLKPKAMQDNLVPFIQDIAQSFQIHASQRNIEFNIIPGKETITAWFDPEMMDKIIYNLLSNAFKFTKKGNITLTINSFESEKDILTNSQFAEGFIEIRVTDTGIGISAEELPHIFDRFYQVDTIHSETTSGSGIGLSLVKELTGLHKGTISVYSVPGKGTSFRLLLPLGKSHFKSDEFARENTHSRSEILVAEELASLEETELESKNSPNNKPVLLVVEDNSDVCYYLSNELSATYQIVTAPNGHEGFEKAIEEIPDLIISDIMMPVMNGIDFCKKIKHDVRTSHIPVVLLTARTGEESVVQGLETGADDYVSKPFSMIILKARIRSLIENRERLREKYRKEIDVNPSEVVVNTLDQQFLEKALKLVEENMSNIHYTPEEFIEKMNMSKTQLYKKLKSLTGQSVSIFIRTIRLKRAAQIMKQGKFPVSEIAFMVGFSDPAYFTKCFKELYNESPSQFAERHLK